MLIGGKRELAYIVQIDVIEPIVGSDNCEAAVVGGWKIMTKKETFKAGDYAVNVTYQGFSATFVGTIDENSVIVEAELTNNLSSVDSEIENANQIIFTSILPSEGIQTFDFSINKDISVSSTGEVLKNWDDIKRQTKKQKSQSEAMAAIPATYPALMKAQKVQEKAKKAGFDWRDSQGAFDKIAEESKELQEVLATGDKEKIEDELGDLFFSVVNTARFCGCDSETALEKATQKFMKRFTVTEKLAAEKGIDMKEASIEVLDELWDEAKKQN